MRGSFITIEDVDGMLYKKDYGMLLEKANDGISTYLLEAQWIFWFKLSEAVRATTNQSEAVDQLATIKVRMLQCEDYDEKSMVEWYLLNAEYWLRKTKPELAIEQINQLDELTVKLELNQPLCAKKYLLKGIAAYQQGETRTSMIKLHEASMACNGYKLEATEDYQSKIRLYWLKLFVKTNNETAERYNLAREIIGGYYIIDGYDWSYQNKPKYFEGDSNLVYRMRARIINLGRYGNNLDDALQKLFVSF